MCTISTGIFLKVGGPCGTMSLEESKRGRDQNNLYLMSRKPVSILSSSLIPKLLVDLCATASGLYALTFSSEVEGSVCVAGGGVPCAGNAR